MANGDEFITLEPGDYYVSGARFVSKVKISSLYKDNRARIICSKNSGSDMLLANGINGIIIEDVILDGNFSNQSGAVRGQSGPRLARFQNCRNVIFNNVFMQNGALDGCRMDTCTNVSIKKCGCKLLGHDAFYFMYNCTDVHVLECNFDINTNSGVRISMGGTNITVENNEIFSKDVTSSTGPCIECDKMWTERGIGFTNIVIKNNNLHNTRGSGIWAFMNAANKVKGFVISGNTINTTGQYDRPYNGYSHAGIAIGRIPATISGNRIVNCPNAIIINEYEYPGTETYKVAFNNNTVSNCKVGFRIDSSRGFIEGSGNAISATTFSYGNTKNVKLDNVDPVENEGEEKDMKFEIELTDSEGRIGRQILDLESTDSMPAILKDKCTVKVQNDIMYGNKTFELPAEFSGSVGENEFVVHLKVIDEDKEYEHSFVLPMALGSGISEFKYRTKDGRFYESPLELEMSAPSEEPERKFTFELAFTMKGDQIDCVVARKI